MAKILNEKNKTNNIVIYLICLYFLLLPFEYFFSTSAGTILRYLAIVIILVITVDTLRLGVNLSKTNVILIIWLLYGLMSYFWAVSYEYWRLGFSIVSRNAMFLIIISFIKINKKDYYKIINTYLYSGTAMALYTILIATKNIISAFEGRVAIVVNGVIFDPNYMVAILIIPMCVALTTFLNKVHLKPFKSIYHLIFYLIMVVAALMTGSRGGFLGVLVVTVLCIIPSIKNRRTQIGVFIFITLVFLLSSAITDILNQEVMNRFRFQNLFGLNDQGGGRLIIWENTINAIKSKPIIGYGAGNVYIANHIFGGKAFGAHNMFLSIAVELGIIGLIIFIYYCIELFKKLITIRAYREIFSFVGILIVCLFLDSLSAKFLWGALSIFTIRTKVSS